MHSWQILCHSVNLLITLLMLSFAEQKAFIFRRSCLSVVALISYTNSSLLRRSSPGPVRWVIVPTLSPSRLKVLGPLSRFDTSGVELCVRWEMRFENHFLHVTFQQYLPKIFSLLWGWFSHICKNWVAVVSWIYKYDLYYTPVISGSVFLFLFFSHTMLFLMLWLCMLAWN